MAKTILANVEGWTPLIDELVRKYGIMTAAVFGRVWRYCQMENGVCQASLETIGKELGISRMTVIRHIEALVKDGYIKDHTPDLKHKPHTYSDTGKVKMKATIAAVNNEEGVSNCDTSEPENAARSNKTLHRGVSNCDLKIPSLRNNLYLSVTPGGQLLQELLTVEYQAKGRRPPEKFKTIAMRDKWLTEAEAKLAPPELEKAIRAALAMDITSLERLVAYCAKWGSNGKSNGNGRGTVAPAPAAQSNDRSLNI